LCGRRDEWSMVADAGDARWPRALEGGGAGGGGPSTIGAAVAEALDAGLGLDFGLGLGWGVGFRAGLGRRARLEL
jgi:hypothetical protein